MELASIKKLIHSQMQAVVDINRLSEVTAKSEPYLQGVYPPSVPIEDVYSESRSVTAQEVPESHIRSGFKFYLQPVQTETDDKCEEIEFTVEKER